MSSVAETPKINQTPKLLRSSSFQKFKCSAFYPFRLAGTKLKKQSITHLLEEFIQKTHILLQKALLVSHLPGCKYVCGLIVCIVEMLARSLGLNLIAREICIPNPIESIKQTSIATQQEIPKTEQKVLKPVEETYKKNLGRFMSTAIDEPVGLRKDNTLLGIISNLCVVLTFMQLIYLSMLMTTVVLPWGFMFLTSNIATIAALLIQIMWLDDVPKSKCKVKKSTNKTTVISAPECENDRRTDNVSPGNTRLSRERTRRFLYFGNKTLSKVNVL